MLCFESFCGITTVALSLNVYLFSGPLEITNTKNDIGFERRSMLDCLHSVYNKYAYNHNTF